MQDEATQVIIQKLILVWSRTQKSADLSQTGRGGTISEEEVRTRTTLSSPRQSSCPQTSTSRNEEGTISRIARKEQFPPRP